MKIKAVANGNVIEADDGAAEQLIAAGIYEKYDEKAEKKTAVAPLTTASLPKKPGRPRK